MSLILWRIFVHFQFCSDQRCGTLDLGTCYLKDTYDVTVGEVKSTGVVTGHAGSFLGEFEKFEYKHLRVLAIYLMLIDPGMLTERHPGQAAVAGDEDEHEHGNGEECE
jgi:hypothetical protein